MRDNWSTTNEGRQRVLAGSAREEGRIALGSRNNWSPQCRFRTRALSAVLVLTILLCASSPCAAWWVGSAPPSDCAPDDLECLAAHREKHSPESSHQQGTHQPQVEEADAEFLRAEVELLRAGRSCLRARYAKTELHSLRSELVRKHQITESLAGALQVASLLSCVAFALQCPVMTPAMPLPGASRRLAEERECESHCADLLAAGGGGGGGAENEAQRSRGSSHDASSHDASSQAAGAGQQERPHLEVNGNREDEDGQTEWIYGVPEGRRKIVIELGANNGEWIAQFLQMHADFWPIIVEAQPTFKDELRVIAQNYGGVYIQRAAWITEGETMTFHAHTDAGGMGSSLFSDSVYSEGFCDGKLKCNESLGEAYDVSTLDVVGLLERVARADDYIVLRMDIEGAEYQVARRLIASGRACWLDNWEFEGHAMYAKQNYKFRPVDGVLPWLLRGCGVKMNVYQYYRADPKLQQLREQVEKDDECAWLRFGVDGCSEAGSCGGIPEE